MTWKELKDIIDNGLKENDMDDTAEFDCVDISDACLQGRIELHVNKDDNTFCVY